MPSKSSSGGLRLPDSAVRSEAPAWAETARGLFGRVNEIYELAAGVAATEGEGALTPPNPQGLVGWDLSGPPWGSALRHSVAWCGGRSPDTATFIQPDNDSDSSRRYTQQRPALIFMLFYNRQHERITGSVPAYARLYWVLRTYRVCGATTPTATAKSWNASLGETEETSPSSDTYTTTASDSQVLSSTLWVNCKPGWNRVALQVTTTDSSVHYLTGFGLQNFVKRLH